jgi:hypothetical protein
MNIGAPMTGRRSVSRSKDGKDIDSLSCGCFGGICHREWARA